jgi:hypothetical protein
MRMGKTLDDAELDAAMHKIDGDGSGEIEFEEFEQWWDIEMATNSAVLPNVFNFKGTACRAVKSKSTGDYMWVAFDLANVLYPSADKKNAKKQTREEIQAAKAAEYKQLQAIWKKVSRWRMISRMRNHNPSLSMGHARRLTAMGAVCLTGKN